MSDDRRPGRGRHLALALVPLLIILAPLGYSVYDAVLAGDGPGEAPFLELPPQPNDGCVRETTYMRFHHWQLLREVRDRAVRDGVRGEITLDSCRGCHANRARFCNRCHAAVSLQPDCFGCHYYPAEPASAGDRAGKAGRSWIADNS
jgi:hypothetical protein